MKILHRLLKPRGSISFLWALPRGASLLDVGCGNNSPSRTLSVRPDLRYVGLDIDPYTGPNYDNMTIVQTASERFASALADQPKKFSAVISNHNIEHVEDPEATLSAMCKALEPGGKLFLAWPSRRSLGLPSRQGTLNYYDDPTHAEALPTFQWVLSRLEANEMRVDGAWDPYRPLGAFLIGLVNEPRSRVIGRNLVGTWELWGFETILHASKL